MVDNAERLDARNKFVARVRVGRHEGDGAIAVVFTEYVHADLLRTSSGPREGNCSAERSSETNERPDEHFVLFLGVFRGVYVYGYLCVGQKKRLESTVDLVFVGWG